jgi:hypothetical protein
MSPFEQAATSPTVIFGVGFVALTVASYLMRDIIREEAVIGYLLVTLSTIGGTMVGTLAVAAIIESPLGVTRAVAIGLAAIGWVWLWAHIEALEPAFKLVRHLGVAISSRADKLEAKQKRASRELAETEARLLALKSDPNYAAAMREVDAMLEPSMETL